MTRKAEGGKAVHSSLLLFIELSCLTAFAAAAVMLLERCLRNYSITVPLKAVETSNLLQHNESVAEEVLRTLSVDTFLLLSFSVLFKPSFSVCQGWVAVGSTDSDPDVDFLLVQDLSLLFFPFKVYKVKMLIVSPCVDPHLVELRCVSYLK